MAELIGVVFEIVLDYLFTSDTGRSNSSSIPVVSVTVKVSRSPEGVSGVADGAGSGVGVEL